MCFVGVLSMLLLSASSLGLFLTVLGGALLFCSPNRQYIPVLLACL